MLPLRGQAVVLGDDRPSIGELADIGLAGVDHRFHGEDHARLQAQPRPRAPVVQHLRLLVKFAADAVSAEFAHDAETVPFGIALYRVADIAEVGARPDGLDAAPHALIGDITQPARLYGRLPDIEHAARVAVKTVLDDRDVDIHDVAGLQLFFARHAVAHDVVYRGADRLRIGLVAGRRVIERRGRGVLYFYDVFMAKPVDFGGRHARLDQRTDVVQDFAGQTAGDAHFSISSADLTVTDMAGPGHGPGRRNSKCLVLQATRL